MEQAYPDYENLSAEAKVFLDKRHVETAWSVRTNHCLTNDGQIFVRQSVIRTETEMLLIPNFDRRPLNEMKGVFGRYGLRFGMVLPPEVIEYGSAAYEAKRAANSTPATAPDNLVSEKSAHLNDIDAVCMVFTGMTSVLQNNQMRGTVKLLRKALLGNLFGPLPRSDVERFYDEVTAAQQRTQVPPHEIAPLLHTLWSMIENTKSPDSA